ncbi:hypothetical protein PSHT_04409 [Puccinia striiformis]|uniref:Uncharacterized protein n=1 Tax=Puccinia striiformis TaxID=27350 RepID=A0A2S4WD94_9BASI|nr:hypothetical protein PSHT_04409 [Puccinia striiformis]
MTRRGLIFLNLAFCAIQLVNAGLWKETPGRLGARNSGETSGISDWVSNAKRKNLCSSAASSQGSSPRQSEGDTVGEVSSLQKRPEAARPYRQPPRVDDEVAYSVINPQGKRTFSQFYEPIAPKPSRVHETLQMQPPPKRTRQVYFQPEATQNERAIHRLAGIGYNRMESWQHQLLTKVKQPRSEFDIEESCRKQFPSTSKIFKRVVLRGQPESGNPTIGLRASTFADRIDLILQALDTLLGVLESDPYARKMLDIDGETGEQLVTWFRSLLTQSPERFLPPASQDLYSNPQHYLASKFMTSMYKISKPEATTTAISLLAYFFEEKRIPDLNAEVKSWDMAVKEYQKLILEAVGRMPKPPGIK